MHDIISNYGRFVAPRLIQIVTVFLSILSFSLQAAEKMNIRGERYCEIIFPESITTYDIYNTFGLNDCPQAIWDQISLDQVKKEVGSSFVHLNGPRYWVIDGFRRAALRNSAPKTLGGLLMQESGVLHLTAYDLLRAKSGAHYQQWRVERNTRWIYEPNKPVYELIDPEGHVFVMQSYTTQAHPQSQASLAFLATQITLPEGWRFKTGILRKQEVLDTVDNVAIVIQDDFLNTYQMAAYDFLASNERS